MLRIIRPAFYYAPSRDGAVGRKTAKQTILRSRAADTRKILLPPFTAASELRVLLGLSYETTFELLNVRHFQKKFFWKDHEGREFETTNKRNVLVPFPLAARAATRFGLEPQMVDVDPVIDEAAIRAKLPTTRSAVVAVIGHTDHGKTSLIDALSGSNARENEAGGITQRVRAAQFGNFTLVDTPGHKALEITRGRAVASSDLAVVVVSAEIRDDATELEDILVQADRLGVPLIFAINKIDLANPEAARKVLINKCRELHVAGALSQDLTSSVKRAIYVSAKDRRNLSDLNQSLNLTVSLLTLPFALPLPTAISNNYVELRRIIREPGRRTDWHTGVLDYPASIGVVLDSVNKNGMLVAVRIGNFKLGDHFACGSAYGKVRSIVGPAGATPSGVSGGEVVEVSGVISGSFAADDIFMVFPRERAFRLAAYRERIAQLNRLQVAGPPLEACGFELDSSLVNSQEHVTRRFSEDEELSEAEKEFSWTPGETPDLRALNSIYVPPHEPVSEEDSQSDLPRPPEYGDRDSWSEQAMTGSARVLSRQAKRDLNRMRARDEQRKLRNKEDQVAEEIRAEIHSRAKAPTGTRIVSRPVVPVIFKCESENLFNGILDEFERLEEELEVKIPVVHGGIGNVNSQDVDHGIAERQFGFCPLYALNVGVSPFANEKADSERIAIIRFNLFTDLVEDVKTRALAIKRRIADSEYREELRRRTKVQTESGL